MQTVVAKRPNEFCLEVCLQCDDAVSICGNSIQEIAIDALMWNNILCL